MCHEHASVTVHSMRIPPTDSDLLSLFPDLCLEAALGTGSRRASQGEHFGLCG